jgi:hypothetical protein
MRSTGLSRQTTLSKRKSEKNKMSKEKRFKDVSEILDYLQEVEK